MHKKLNLLLVTKKQRQKFNFYIKKSCIQSIYLVTLPINLNFNNAGKCKPQKFSAGNIQEIYPYKAISHIDKINDYTTMGETELLYHGYCSMRELQNIYTSNNVSLCTINVIIKNHFHIKYFISF